MMRVSVSRNRSGSGSGVVRLLVQRVDVLLDTFGVRNPVAVRREQGTQPAGRRR
jgi:hypothetical protein